MKRLPFLFACIIAFISVNVFSASAADMKIGVVDSQKIIMQSEKTAKYRADFAKEFEGKQQEFSKKQSAAQELENELKTKGNTMTSEVYREKAENLRIQARDLKRMKEEMEAELKAKEDELTRRFYREINIVIDDFLEKEKYTLILEKNRVVASADAIDITDQIMKLYDAKP
jgi:outer membrane protein